jgi:hypothetical protein
LICPKALARALELCPKALARAFELCPKALARALDCFHQFIYCHLFFSQCVRNLPDVYERFSNIHICITQLCSIWINRFLSRWWENAHHTREGGPEILRNQTFLPMPSSSFSKLTCHRQGFITAFALGSYYNKPVTHAINGPELSSMKHLIASIVEVAPLADLKYKPMKIAFQKLLLKHADFRAQFPSRDLAAIASDLSNSLITVCNHARRLKEEVKWSQAIAKCTLNQISALKEIKALFPKSNSESQPEDIPATQDLLDLANEQLSDGGSLPDSDEYEVDEASSEAPSLLEEALKTPPVPSKKPEIKRIISLKRPASALESGQASSSKRGKGTAPASSSSDVLVRSGTSASFGPLSMTYATNQSYIQYVDSGSSKKKLLIAVSMKQSTEHKSIM